MRAVIQRVTAGSVTVEGVGVTGQIGKGLVVLVGLATDDTENDMDWMINKIINCRLWPSEDNPPKSWHNSAFERQYGILFTSQFTLMGCSKARKPDFHRAMSSNKAKEMYELFLKKVGAVHSGPVQDGVFGAMMNVKIENDGPVTIILDSNNRNDDVWPSKLANPTTPIV